MLKKEINLKEAMRAYQAREKAVADRRIYERWLKDTITESGRKTVERDINKAIATIDTESANMRDALLPLLDALTAAQGKARVRTITAVDIVRELCDIVDTLNIPKKAMDGITVDVDLHAQSFPGAYHGVPESTHFAAYYKAGYWRVTDIYRGNVSGETLKVIVTHTDASKAALIRRFTTWA